MHKKIIHSLFFLILLAFLFLLGTNLTFNYGRTLEEINPTLEWEFFHEQLIEPEEAANYVGKGQPITLPHQFKDNYPTAKTFGTYIAKVTLPPDFLNKKIGVFIPFEYGSYKLYMDNELVLSKGTFAQNEADYELQIGPKIGAFVSEREEIFITLQLSNYSSIRGGFAKPIQLGEYEALLAKHYTAITCFFFIIGLIFILGLFLLHFSIRLHKNVSSYVLAGICIAFAIRSFFARPFIYSMTALEISWEWAVKIEAFSTIVIMILFIRLCQEMVFPYISQKFFIPAYSIAFIQGLLVAFTSPILFQQTFIFLFLLHLYYIPYCIFIFIKHYQVMNFDQKMQFFGFITLAIATIHDVFVVSNVSNQIMLIQFAIIIYTLIQLIIKIRNYENNLKEVLLLNKKITNLNTSLEEKVARRTKELVTANKQLELLASKDGLTGIANRHVFDKSLAYYFEKTRTHGNILTLFMMDLDHFKQYNDTYGHQAGDELLNRVVKATEDILPPVATFARYGGEEFAILIDDPEIDVADLGYKIVQHIEAQQFEHSYCMNGFATISLGAYQITSGHSLKQPRDLIIAADQQLYAAKKAGKNQFMFSKS